jgi:hypothetical protein
MLGYNANAVQRKSTSVSEEHTTFTFAVQEQARNQHESGSKQSLTFTGLHGVIYT